MEQVKVPGASDCKCFRRGKNYPCGHSKISFSLLPCGFHRSLSQHVCEACGQ